MNDIAHKIVMGDKKSWKWPRRTKIYQHQQFILVKELLMLVNLKPTHQNLSSPFKPIVFAQKILKMTSPNKKSWKLTSPNKNLPNSVNYIKKRITELGKFETHQPKPFFTILTTVTIAYDMVWFTALRILQHRGQFRAKLKNICNQSNLKCFSHTLSNKTD